jgi:hypothetical protein
MKDRRERKEQKLRRGIKLLSSYIMPEERVSE